MARTRTRKPGPSTPTPPSALPPAPLEEKGPAVVPVPQVYAAALAVLLVLLVALAFAPCLGNDFVSWDDGKNFLGNPFYRGLGWSQIYWAWTSFQIGVYQPLAWMILEVEYVLFGLKPWGYHLTSLILYAINTVVLFVLTLSLLARCRSSPEREDSWGLMVGAGLAVALFAIHPLRTEVVVWASCQPYLPCALFSMLAVLAYLRAHPPGDAPRLGWLAVTFLLCAAALLSKAVAVSLPFVLLILDVYPLRRLGWDTGPGRWLGPAARRVWLEKIVFAGMSLICMGVAIAGRAQADPSVPNPDWGLPSRLAQACYGIWFYLIKTVLPTDLTAYYPIPERVALLDPLYLLSLLGTLGVSVGLVLMRRRWPGLLAVWLSYLVILGPNLGFVWTGGLIAADRYSYIAMTGGVALLAAALGRIRRAGQGGWPAAAVLTVASLAALLVLITLSRGQCRIWRTSEILWTHALSHGASLSADAHSNLANALGDQGRLEEATAQYAEAIRLNPNHAVAHNNLALILSRQRRFDEAVAHYAEALRSNPNHVTIHNNLAAALRDQGRLDEARAEFAAVVRLKPDDADAHTSLGSVLYQQGRLDEAKAEYAEAIRLNPKHTDAHTNLGSVLYQQGRLDEAKAEYAEAIRLNPKHVEARTNLAAVLLSRGQIQGAMAKYTEVLRLDPNHADAHTNLGSILYHEGRLDEAQAQYAEAARLAPNSAGVHNNRARIWATAAAGKFRDGRRAVESATRACELTGWKNAGFVDTLAAACAEAGDFEQAVKWQSQAIELASDAKAKAAFRTRLLLYQQRHPYHEAIPRR